MIYKINLKKSIQLRNLNRNLNKSFNAKNLEFGVIPKKTNGTVASNVFIESNNTSLKLEISAVQEFRQVYFYGSTNLHENSMTF